MLIASSAAVVLYAAAYFSGVREWRCFVKPPWVVVFYVLVAAGAAYFLFWHRPALVI